MPLSLLGQVNGVAAGYPQFPKDLPAVPRRVIGQHFAPDLDLVNDILGRPHLLVCFGHVGLSVKVFEEAVESGACVCLVVIERRADCDVRKGEILDGLLDLLVNEVFLSVAGRTAIAKPRLPFRY